MFSPTRSSFSKLHAAPWSQICTRHASDERSPYWVRLRGNNQVKQLEEMPGPKPLPYFGNKWRYWPVIGQYSLDYLSESYEKMLQMYGPIVRETGAKGETVVHVFHPEDMMTVYTNDRQFPLRPSHRALGQYRNERPHLYASAGLGPSNGPEWQKFRRQTCLATLTKIISQKRDEMVSITNDLMGRIRANLDRRGEADILPLIYLWALECIGLITLDKRLGCLQWVERKEAKQLIQCIHTTNDAIYRTQMGIGNYDHHYQRLVAAQDYCSKVIREYIQEAAESKNDKSFLSLISADGNGNQLKDACTLIMDFFQGGIHTVSVTSVFMIYHLAMNKEIQEKARSTSGTDRNNFLRSFIYEVLRINPPTIGNGRVLQRDLVLGGYKVPAGTVIHLQHQVASIQAEYFEDPLKFMPERWGQGSLSQHARFASSPFSTGPRTCFGRNIAMTELNLILDKILENFRVSYHHKKPRIVNKLHNEPDRPLKIKFEILHKD